ncbi:MAG: TIGR01440 family protein [Bacillaceae bacterium]|nr:TIGR01440 family protein [Bacillaceae bacterium]
MMAEINASEVRRHIREILEEWVSLNQLKKGMLVVIGCSTSEIAGQRIGTSGSNDLAAVLFSELEWLRDQTGVSLAFQGCEHINRALVVERETMERKNLNQVTVVPIPGAGGSMAAYAYQHMQDPVMVEHIQADAGLDIGDTFIGMHLKPVVVPLRFKRKNIGHAHVTAAFTRPKLIGGERAVYSKEKAYDTTCD